MGRAMNPALFEPRDRVEQPLPEGLGRRVEGRKANAQYDESDQLDNGSNQHDLNGQFSQTAQLIDLEGSP